MHFFNPAPVMKLVEVIRTVVTEQDVIDDVEAFAQQLGKTDVTDRRPRRLHRQRAAVRLPQPRRRAVRVALRHPRGHRRGHEARLRPADGPARAARPDRPRHRLRDPRHDVQAGARPAARPAADLQADDHRRPARPEVRPRLLHLRRAGLAERRGRRADAGQDAQLEGARDGVARRRRRLGHDGHRHRRGLRQGRLRRHLRRPLAGARSTQSSPPITRSLDKAVQRGKLAEDDRDAALAPDHRHRRRSTTWPRAAGRRGRGRGPRTSSRRCSPTSTTSARPARCWPPRPPRCR